MMNLIAILIPALLASMAFVELSVLEVDAAGDGGAGAGPPLELRLAISERGFRLGVSGSAVRAEPQELELPLVGRTLDCRRFVGTAPPPRSANAVACEAPEQKHGFVVYDLEGLEARLVELKALAPEVRQITITADPEVQYEALTDAMDVSRSFAGPDGRQRPLFDEVLVSPPSGP